MIITHQIVYFLLFSICFFFFFCITHFNYYVCTLYKYFFLFLLNEYESGLDLVGSSLLFIKQNDTSAELYIPATFNNQ